MTIVFPNMVAARAEIHLDMVDSLGGPVLEMRQNNARPMALSRRGGELWYGFVINDSTVDVILPGERVACVVSFLNMRTRNMRSRAARLFCSVTE